MKKLNVILLAAALFASVSTTQKSATGSGTEPLSQRYNGPIIDMHIHALGEGEPLFGMTHPPTLRGKTYKGAASAVELKEKTLEKFRKHHIVKAVVTNGQLWSKGNEELVIIGDADKSISALKKQFEENKLKVIAEMSPFYAGMLANDASVMPYFELAQTLNIPVGVHILPGGPNYGIHHFPEMLGNMRVKNANPLQLEDALVKYPKLKLYIMHGGWPYVEDLKALMYAHPNVYVDIAVLNWILPLAEFHNYIRSLVDAGYGDRILFGTDQIVWPDTIDDAVESVNSADFLTIKQKEDIFYNNAARFLGLSTEEIAKHKAVHNK
ncbi:amidohydrolase family protein [Lacibacter sp. MH-610]|uniref:amidohydrolase family protein n=1 Tax=Lacibacter sp. MH-610 TaxID=3020883 RepID=UPI003891E007